MAPVRNGWQIAPIQLIYYLVFSGPVERDGELMSDLPYTMEAQQWPETFPDVTSFAVP